MLIPRGPFCHSFTKTAKEKQNETQCSCVPLCGHVDGAGIQPFRAACEIDLEGMVAKRRDSRYLCDERSADWIKIKNPQYSQIRGRHELFATRET